MKRIRVFCLWLLCAFIVALIGCNGYNRNQRKDLRDLKAIENRRKASSRESKKLYKAALKRHFKNQPKDTKKQVKRKY